MQRHVLAIKVKPEKLDEYRKLHRSPWPEIVDNIKRANIDRYSIYHVEGYLISIIDYSGDDFDKDMLIKSQLQSTSEWRKLTTPCPILST